MINNVCQGCGKEYVSRNKRTYCPGECMRIRERSVTLNIWRAASSHRQRADNRVDAAIKRGDLLPQPCEVCGTNQQVVAHHDDYAAPLDVRWLCRAHHSLHHLQHGPGKNA